MSQILKEEVLFNKSGVTSLDRAAIRSCASPSIRTWSRFVVQRLDEPSTGAGEEVMGATAAALANAFFDAIGVRLRQYPMTPDLSVGYRPTHTTDRSFRHSDSGCSQLVSSRADTSCSTSCTSAMSQNSLKRSVV